MTRFLPYSTKGRLPTAPALVRAYLAFPPAWWLLGKQTLYVGIAAVTDGATARARRSSCPSTTRARPSSRSCEAWRTASRRRTSSSSCTTSTGHDRPGHRAPGRRAAGAPRPPQRPRAWRPQRDEGGHRRDDRAVRPDLHGGRLRRAAGRRPDGRARARRRRRRRRVALHARRATDRRPAAQAPDEPDGRPDAALVRRRRRPTTRRTTSSSTRAASWTPSRSRARPASSSRSS